MVAAGPETRPPLIANPPIDDLSREVFGVVGLTLDALNFRTALRSIQAACDVGSPYLISTPNVNFMVTSRRNPDFRESVLCSDLCIADGMPLIWIARILGIPIRERITGADLFDTLKLPNERGRRFKVFLFGGADGVAEVVSAKLNASSAGMECVGALYPGYGTVDDMSSDRILDTINASGADLLAVFLGAEKAQTWLLQNHRRIKIPVRAQFGAAINFEAGTLRRAPALLRNTGLEWLWRIKEEPYLWRRYWNDGLGLIAVFVACVLPLAMSGYWSSRKAPGTRAGLTLDVREDDGMAVVAVSGAAVSDHIGRAIDGFRAVLGAGADADKERDVVVDCARLAVADHRFVGLLLMVRKQLARRGRSLRFVNVTPGLRRFLRLNGFAFLLDT